MKLLTPYPHNPLSNCVEEGRRRGEERREEGRGGVADRTACHFIHTIYISPPIYLIVRNYNVDLNPRRHYEGLVTPVDLKNYINGLGDNLS